MAVISRIRKRVGLLIGFVGVSMVLFILGDLVTSNKGIMNGNSDVVGNINGEKVHYSEFEGRVNQMVETYKANTKQDNIDAQTQDMLREQAWNMLINENVLGKEYKKIGLSCSADELYDMCTGPNPHPQVKQAFTDPKTQQFDPSSVVRFLKDLPNRDETVQRQWKTFEDAIRDERISTKYKDMVKMGLFVTTEEAKRNLTEGQRSATIRFVRLDFNTIPDSSVKVEDSDLRAFYNSNQNRYKQAETVRKVEYITFDVTPSQEDLQSVITYISSKKADFASSTNDLAFVSQYSDAPVDSAYHAKGQLTPAVDTVLFNAPIGTVVGPYLDGTSYKISKLVSEKMVSDSVKARHILLRIDNGDTAKAMATADSLRNAIKKGSSFVDLATRFSTDPGSAVKGGDLGWFRPGMMVAEFNDACFNGNKGDMPIVKTQFGVHLIEIMEKGAATRQIQVATVERKVEPSQKTYDAIYNKANDFISKNNTAQAFDSAIVKQGLNKRIADNIRENDRTIAGLDQPRELVRWAYTADNGDVSKIFTFGDKYVIAHLVSIKEKGILPLDEVREQVKVEAIKKKKSEMLVEKFNNAGSTDINAIAQKLNTTPVDAPGVTFGNTYIQGLGNEPAVVGVVSALKKGQVSKPIAGDNAVVVVSVIDVTEAPATTDYSASVKQVVDQRKSRSEYEVFNSLKEKANIEDNRGKFY
jgi:peptidyl-prolyl cis-trans isomerase D